MKWLKLRHCVRLLRTAAVMVAIIGMRVRGDLLPPTDASTSLANLTGSDVAQCQQLLSNLTGSDPSTLLDGLSPTEAAEMLELLAELRRRRILMPSMAELERLIAACRH